jgi:uncharacterized protein
VRGLKHSLPGVAALLAVVLGVAVPGATRADARAADPAADPEASAGMVEISIDSHGSSVYGVFYRAAGTGVHGTVVLLHGFPGFEQNEDLAQALRRGGWNVLMFHYRGAWGSEGEFSFSHCVEDVQEVLAYLRTPEIARRLHSDPRRLVLVGHSVGGVLAGVVAAADPKVMAVAMISAANRHLAMAQPAWEQQTVERFGRETGPLRGTTAPALVAELRANADQWDLVRLAPLWKPRPVLIVRSDDMFGAESVAFATAARQSDPAAVTAVHLTSDHVYSNARIELARVLLRWIQGLPAPPRR